MPKSISIYIPDELADRMGKLPEVNWSEIARQCIENYIEQRKPTEEEKLHIRLLEPRQIRCTPLPRFFPKTQEFDIVYRIENQSEEDLILDRLLYEIRVMQENGRTAIGIIRGLNLEKTEINKGSGFSMLEKPSVPKELLQKMIETASSSGNIEMRFSGTIYFDSRKGPSRVGLYADILATPIFFEGGA